MRKYMYLITDAPDETLVGGVDVTDGPKNTTAEKNVEGVTHKRDLETGETWEEYEVGLGYADFEDEADYEDRIHDVLNAKLREIDDEHLEKAGVDKEAIAA